MPSASGQVIQKREGIRSILEKVNENHNIKNKDNILKNTRIPYESSNFSSFKKQTQSGSSSATISESILYTVSNI